MFHFDKVVEQGLKHENTNPKYPKLRNMRAANIGDASGQRQPENQSADSRHPAGPEREAGDGSVVGMDTAVATAPMCFALSGNRRPLSSSWKLETCLNPSRS